MLSVTLHLLSLVALGAAQTSPVAIWVPPMAMDLKTPSSLHSQDVVASVAGSVREPRAGLENAQLTHVYAERQCNNICTRLRFKNKSRILLEH